jgi:hypothetical protein
MHFHMNVGWKQLTVLLLAIGFVEGFGHGAGDNVLKHAIDYATGVRVGQSDYSEPLGYSEPHDYSEPVVPPKKGDGKQRVRGRAAIDRDFGSVNTYQNNYGGAYVARNK